jgi:hypothetical protein
MNGPTKAPAGGADQEDKVFSIEQVLAREVKVISGKALATNPEDQTHEELRKRLNDDQQSKFSDKSNIKSRYEFYAELNSLNRAALCCSGGGIRSATFCLGVIQAFASCNLSKTATPAEHSATSASSASGIKETEDHANSALCCFHYLSTVSGGGYIGSWLSTWRFRAGLTKVIEGLTGRRQGPDIEPAPISWLRAYSNYLTPTLGITSADSWAAVSIVIRNLILNWLVIIPIVCLVLLALKLIAAGSVWIAHGDVDQYGLVLKVLAAGIVLLIVAHAFTTRDRPSLRAKQTGDEAAQQTNTAVVKKANGEAAQQTNTAVVEKANGGDTQTWVAWLKSLFVWVSFTCSILSAVAVTIFFSSRYFSSLLDMADLDHGIVKWHGVSAKISLPAVAAGVGLVIYGFGWLFGYIFSWVLGSPLNPKQGGLDLLAWALSGLVYGALVGLGAYLFALLGPYPATLGNIRCLLISVILGVPWVLAAQLLAEVVFVGLTSRENDSDFDREWLGRSAGWLAVFAVVWAVTAFLVFAGSYVVEFATTLGHQSLVKAGGLVGIVSGIFTALLGASSKTPVKPSSKDQNSWTTFAYNAALAVAGPVFVAVLIVGLSVILDGLLLDGVLIKILQPESRIQQAKPVITLPAAGFWLMFGLFLSLAVEVVASLCVNINRFSLHALYRNRLIRAYLGASNKERKPDAFSGFDFNDNICVHKIWVDDWAKKEGRLFHVINIALNVVSTKRLAWQERKAEPFTVSPKHCGSAYLGFRVSQDYGGQTKDRAEAKAAKAEAEAKAAQAEAEAEAAKAEAKAEANANAEAAKAEAKTKAAKAAKVESGLSLGTAMAISGAAASPNMGYNSSPSIALLLTLFNVRLGWWLGNPGKEGNDTYHKEGPQFAARPLLSEAFGQTSDTSPYVYLSDGGHFENLGLYEMVRRRCRFIVVIDAGCDPDFAFEDLGNAVRKIYIDLGIRITFEELAKLKTRPSAKSYSREVRNAEALANLRAHNRHNHGSETAEPGEVPYHAIGVIHYEDADVPPPPKPGTLPKDTTEPLPARLVENGYVLYIKPAYHGDEGGAGIRNYATANPDFPHEATLDQWFTESQFESYRSLGLDIANDILDRRDEIVLKAGNQREHEPDFTLDSALQALKIGP